MAALLGAFAVARDPSSVFSFRDSSTALNSS